MRVEFGFLSYKLLILLLFPIFNQIDKFVFNIKTSSLYYYFTFSISYLLAGIFYLIILYRSKNHKKLSSLKHPEIKLNAIEEVFLENQNIIKQRKIKKLISIFLLALIYLLPILIQGFVLNVEIDKIFTIFARSFGVLCAILFYAFFSKILLNSKIYRHQIISLCIIFFCSLIFLLISIYYEIYQKSTIFSYWVLTFFCFIVIYGFYALYNVLVKRHFETHLNHPYHLMFYVGLFSLILIIPLDLFVHFYDKEGIILEKDIINQIKDLYKKYNLKFICLFIFDITCKFITFLGIILTLYYFTPCHFIISFTFSEFLHKFIDWIIERINNNNKNNEWFLTLVYFFLYVIIIFSILIYNEIIIIHLWSMEKNTFKYISFRQKLEFENSIINEDERITERSTTLSVLFEED